MKSSGTVVWAVAGVAILASSLVAQANPKLQKAFLAKYGVATGTKLAKCGTCHTAKAPALNPYGKDLKAAQAKAAHAKFEAVEKRDSDQDGAPNLAEIKALTLPGDPKDKPAAAAADSTADSTAAAPKDSAAKAEPDSGAKSPPR